MHFLNIRSTQDTKNAYETYRISPKFKAFSVPVYPIRSARYCGNIYSRQIFGTVNQF